MLNIILGCANLDVNTERALLLDNKHDTLLTGTEREIKNMLVTLNNVKYIDTDSIETKDNFYMNTPIICKYRDLNIITSTSHAQRCHKIVRLLGYKGTINFTLYNDGLKETIELSYWNRF